MTRSTKGGKRFTVTPGELKEGLESLGQSPGVGDLESIVLKIGRPALSVQNNSFQIDGSMIPSWRDHSKLLGRDWRESSHRLAGST